eukprot:TRINITY_DN1903_c1_g1_i1.p1 TRINITY_DN1903_c1_g1~~TRINITY_DN1903_c1_g1_i1.p1  ORF type:complete len:400 (+),score=80.48 TRINITY_DN1903_c1_g1_i1:150-1349(+)
MNIPDIRESILRELFKIQPYVGDELVDDGSYKSFSQTYKMRQEQEDFRQESLRKTLRIWKEMRTVDRLMRKISDRLMYSNPDCGDILPLLAKPEGVLFLLENGASLLPLASDWGEGSWEFRTEYKTSKGWQQVGKWMMRSTDPEVGKRLSYFSPSLVTYCDDTQLSRSFVRGSNLGFDSISSMVSESYHGNNEIILKELVDHPKFDPNHRIGSHGSSNYLYDAVKLGHDGIIRILVSHPHINVNIRSWAYGNTPLIRACRWGYDKIVQILLSHPKIEVVGRNNGYGQNPLYLASKWGYQKIFDMLMERPEIDVNQTSEFRKNSPLNIASYHGNQSIVASLIAHPQIDLNLPNVDGNTPLHSAYLAGHLKIAKMLLKAGAHSTMLNREGKVPASCSVSKE